jgi:signal transduction histidine kinase
LLEETAAEQLDEESRLFLHNIRHGAAQMQALIADLLAYARMERRALGNDVLDLRACIDEILRGYADEIAAQGFDMRVEVPAFTVRADRDGLAIVLRNVLENAFKFRQGDRTLVVEVGARRQDGSQDGNVVLWVRDNGIGFDMKFQERIFEIFSRLERAEDYPGTGVGLALVRKAMHRMGGRVWVDSMPGRGTTFFLELRHD